MRKPLCSYTQTMNKLVANIQHFPLPTHRYFKLRPLVALGQEQLVYANAGGRVLLCMIPGIHWSTSCSLCLFHTWKDQPLAAVLSVAVLPNHQPPWCTLVSMGAYITQGSPSEPWMGSGSAIPWISPRCWSSLCPSLTRTVHLQGLWMSQQLRCRAAQIWQDLFMRNFIISLLVSRSLLDSLFSQVIATHEGEHLCALPFIPMGSPQLCLAPDEPGLPSKALRPVCAFIKHPLLHVLLSGVLGQD